MNTKVHKIKYQKKKIIQNKYKNKFRMKNKNSNRI